MADRQGVEIDYCPKCRGVWLDRGELDKIIERSAAYNEGGSAATDSYSGSDKKAYGDRQQYPQQGGYYNDPRYKNDPHYKHKKKKGFLGDLFDFD